MVVLLAGFFGRLGWQFGPDLAEQTTQLQKTASEEFTTRRMQMQQRSVIQRRAINLPPALALLAQTTFGLIFGLFGIILFTALTPAILAAVQQLTKEDPDC